MIGTSVPSPPPSPGPRRGGRLRATLVAALFGAVAGALLVRLLRRSGPAPGFGLPHSPMAVVVLLWIVLSVYWEVAARRASAARSAESGGSRALHLMLVSAAQLLVIWPYAGWPSPTPFVFEFPRVLPAWPWLPPLGLALAAGGVGFSIWARRHLGRHWSGEVTVKEGHELVRSGPYRRIRHPIYTGLLAMYLGTALVSGRLQGPLGLALAAVAYARKIPQEERALSGEFGVAYAAYRRESWAIVPGLL